MREDLEKYLRDRILLGTYRAGERLLIDDIAREIGASTMPVREALNTLAHEGMIERLPRRGFAVAQLTLQDIADVFEVHAFLEGIVAERAAKSITDSHLAELRAVQGDIERLVESTDVDEKQTEKIAELNLRFHRLVAQPTDNSRLIWFLRTTSRFIPLPYFRDVPGWVDATVHRHPEILDALERRDGEAARRAMVEHVLEGGRLAIAELARRGLGHARTDRESGTEDE